MSIFEQRHPDLGRSFRSDAATLLGMTYDVFKPKTTQGWVFFWQVLVFVLLSAVVIGSSTYEKMRFHDVEARVVDVHKTCTARYNFLSFGIFGFALRGERPLKFLEPVYRDCNDAIAAAAQSEQGYTLNCRCPAFRETVAFTGLSGNQEQATVYYSNFPGRHGGVSNHHDSINDTIVLKVASGDLPEIRHPSFQQTVMRGHWGALIALIAIFIVSILHIIPSRLGEGGGGGSGISGGDFGGGSDGGDC